jgi:hypothetical protein
MSFTFLLQFLSELELRKVIVKDSGSWSYTWKRRVFDLLNRYRNSEFSYAEILKHVCAPLQERENIKLILKDLQNKGLAFEVSPNFWTSSNNDEIKWKQLLKHKIHDFIISQLTDNGGSVTRTFLSSRTLNFAYNENLMFIAVIQKKMTFDPGDIYIEVMRDLILSGRIIQANGTFTLVA